MKQPEANQPGRYQPSPVLDKAGRAFPWLVPIAMIATAYATGLLDGDWRSAPEALADADPRALLPGIRLGLEPWSTLLIRWIFSAATAALIGAATWTRRGNTPGFGLFAACAAFSICLSMELPRWFKSDQVPDFCVPLAAALVAPLVWWLARLLPAQPVTPLPRFGPWRTRRRVLWRFLLLGCGAGLLAGVVFAVQLTKDLGFTPASVALRVDRLPNNRSGPLLAAARAIVEVFDRSGLGPWLMEANRIDRPDDLPFPDWVGASGDHDGVLPDGRFRSVNTLKTFVQAIETAMPGDVILLQPGVYNIRESPIGISRPGAPGMPVTVRAPHLGSVILDSNLPEALKLAAPYWKFENLVLRGSCADDTACDNGFHIVGAAEYTVLHNMRIEDFNAQIKINGEGGKYPDHGRIDHTTLIDTHPRRTAASVVPIDLVAASDWTIEDNLIADFVKIQGDGVSYGAYAKGEGRGTVFARNVILCEWRLRGLRTSAIGLSFGGGGTDSTFMRQFDRSGAEHTDGAMEDNLIAFCSDAGIYLNRAAGTMIRRNTLLGTTGILVRYPESMARIDNNVVDGSILTRDDGLFWGDGNERGTLPDMFLGHNPVRAFFTDPARFDLTWRRLPPLTAAGSGIDLCGVERSEVAPPGAFLDFRACGQRKAR